MNPQAVMLLSLLLVACIGSMCNAQQCSTKDTGSETEKCKACTAGGKVFGPEDQANSTTCAYCLKNDVGNFTGCVASSAMLPCNGLCPEASCVNVSTSCPKAEESTCIGGRNASACWENYMIYIIAAAGGIILLLALYCYCLRKKGKSVRGWIANQNAEAQRKHRQLEEDSRERHAQRDDRAKDIRSKYGLGGGSNA